MSPWFLQTKPKNVLRYLSLKLFWCLVPTNVRTIRRHNQNILHCCLFLKWFSILLYTFFKWQSPKRSYINPLTMQNYSISYSEYIGQCGFVKHTFSSVYMISQGTENDETSILPIFAYNAMIQFVETSKIIYDSTDLIYFLPWYHIFFIIKRDIYCIEGTGLPVTQIKARAINLSRYNILSAECLDCNM